MTNDRISHVFWVETVYHEISYSWPVRQRHLADDMLVSENEVSEDVLSFVLSKLSLESLAINQERPSCFSLAR